MSGGFASASPSAGRARRGGPLWILGRLADVPSALALLALALPLLLAARLTRGKPGRTGLLLLGYGGERKATIDKLGSLRINTTFNPQGIFDRVAVVNYPALCPGRLEIDPRTLAVDLGVPGPFYLSSAVLALLDLVRLARRESLTVVRTTEMPHLLPLALAVGWAQSCPVVMSIHNDWEPRRLYSEDTQTLYGGAQVRRLMERLLYPRVDEAWPVFPRWREAALRRGVPGDRIRDFPHGIDLTRFRTAPPEGYLRGLVGADPRPIVAWAARLSSDTFAHQLPDIIERTVASSDVLFVVAGRGTEEERIRAQLERRGLSGSVRLLGFIPREEVPWLVSSAAVNLCPFGGYATLEMLASGRPTVVYDLGWNLDVVQDGRTGLVAKAGDAADCARRILWALGNPVEAGRIGAAGRDFAFERHDWEKVEALKASMYRGVLARKAA